MILIDMILIDMILIDMILIDFSKLKIDQELMTNDPKKDTQEQLLVQLNTFLSIVEKLMFQHLHRSNKKLTKKSQRFSSSFLTNLERLVQLTCMHMVKLKAGNERSVDLWIENIYSLAPSISNSDFFSIIDKLYILNTLSKSKSIG